MARLIEGNVEQVLIESDAKAGDQFGDDFGNVWLVHEDRDGLRLEIKDCADAWIPYWTATKIRLPGLHLLSEEQGKFDPVNVYYGA